MKRALLCTATVIATLLSQAATAQQLIPTTNALKGYKGQLSYSGVYVASELGFDGPGKTPFRMTASFDRGRVFMIFRDESGAPKERFDGTVKNDKCVLSSMHGFTIEADCSQTVIEGKFRLASGREYLFAVQVDRVLDDADFKRLADRPSPAPDDAAPAPIAAPTTASTPPPQALPAPSINSDFKTWRRPDGTLVSAMRPIANPKDAQRTSANGAAKAPPERR